MCIITDEGPCYSVLLNNTYNRWMGKAGWVEFLRHLPLRRAICELWL